MSLHHPASPLKGGAVLKVAAGIAAGGLCLYGGRLLLRYLRKQASADQDVDWAAPSPWCAPAAGGRRPAIIFCCYCCASARPTSAAAIAPCLHLHRRPVFRLGKALGARLPLLETQLLPPHIRWVAG